MTAWDELRLSQSLSKRVNVLEQQVMLRRHRMRTAAAGIKHKISARMASPTLLLAAVGIGVVMEQTGRHRGWSPATALDAAHAGIRLLLSVPSPAQSATSNTIKQPK